MLPDSHGKIHFERGKILLIWYIKDLGTKYLTLSKFRNFKEYFKTLDENKDMGKYFYQ